MKVLVLTTCYPGVQRSSSGIFIHRQVRALADLGVTCHVLQPTHWTPPEPLRRLRETWRTSAADFGDMQDEVDGIRVHHPRVFLPVPSRFFPGDYWERVGRAVARHVRESAVLRDADLLYAHFLSDEGYAGLIATRLLDIPLVAIARGDDVHAWPLRWPDRQEKLAAVLAGAERVLANSGRLAEDARRWARGAAPEVGIAYNGIDLDRFAPPAKESDRLEAREKFRVPPGVRALLCVAWPSAAKGWLDLFDALSAIRHQMDRWQLLVATPPCPDPLDLDAEAKRRGIDHLINPAGYVPPSEMPELFRAADAFVLASHNEGLSNSLLEALATGLAVVATDVGGHAEVVEDGRSGLLVPAREPQRLADALRAVLTDAELRARLARGARASAAKVGNTRTNAERLVPHFVSAIERHRARRAPASLAVH